jgi:glycosyltransferase involved in cell wall biosynthesis
MISVIIPAFNSEKFIRYSVLSAINLKEVGEVIIIDDGSTDNTHQICRELSLENDKIVLLQHPNNTNLGESASRNLGILKAKYNFVSFLDSDDYYLSNRFENELEIFETYPEVSAIYSKTGIKFIGSENIIEFGGEFHERMKSPFQEKSLRIVFEEKLTLFDVNGITLKKDFLLEGKLFDKRLKLHPDTELWWRLLKRGYFYPGNINNPVAIALRHGNNVIQKKSIISELKLIVIYIDNVEVKYLEDFEKEYFVYFISRSLSNPYNTPQN